MKFELIDGKRCRKLAGGELIRKTDLFNDGHEVESYSINRKFKKSDSKYYQVYREVKL